MLLVVLVDDIVLIRNDAPSINALKDYLRHSFDIKDLECHSTIFSGLKLLVLLKSFLFL